MVETPSFSITLAPSPKNRIFRPFRSATDLISLRNQPDASGGMIRQGMLCKSYLANISREISRPPP